MKKYIIQSLRLTGVLMIILCVAYPMFIAFAGGFSNGKGGGEKISRNGRVVGYANIGQSFTRQEYFWGRPSAVNYNAAGSGGSNKAPSNADYLKEVAGRIDTILKYHPGLTKDKIPAEMVTASGSGLDPDISVQGALIQAGRVAGVRGIEIKEIEKLISERTIGPLFGLFGPSSVNVLELNIALDALVKQQ